MHEIASIAPPRLERAMDQQCETVPNDSDALERLWRYLELTRPLLQEIKVAVSEFYGLDVADLIARSRRYEFVLPRQMFCFLAYRYTRFSLATIGRQVGLTDHSTVWHAVKKIERYVITKPLVHDDVDLLRLRISEKVLRRRQGAGRC